MGKTVYTPLRKLRVALGLNQAQVAEALGMQRPNYCRMENGAGVNARTAERISLYFGRAVTEEQILFPERFPDYLGKNFERFRKSTLVKSQEPG